MYYEKTIKINYYDCDCSNLLKLSCAMQHLQQTSSEQLERLGFSPARLYAENMVFLLSKMCIKINRMPEGTSEVKIGTTPVGTQGVRFLREFVIKSREGERLLSALTLWVLVDPHSHKVIRPSKFPYQLQFQPTILDGAVADQEVPGEQEEGTPAIMDIPIRYSHLDLNRHVNNSVYGDFICDALPYEKLTARGLDTVILNFRNEVRWGDNLRVSAAPLPKEGYRICGQREGSVCFDAYVTLR
jgi:acyl-ACP thioesterase